MWRCFRKYKTQPKNTLLMFNTFSISPPHPPRVLEARGRRVGCLFLSRPDKEFVTTYPIQGAQVKTEANVLPQTQHLCMSSVGMNLETAWGQTCSS